MGGWELISFDLELKVDQRNAKSILDGTQKSPPGNLKMLEDCRWRRLDRNPEINPKRVPSDIRCYYILLQVLRRCSRLTSLSHYLFIYYSFLCCSFMQRLVCFFIGFIVQVTFHRKELRMVESWPSGTFSHLHTGCLEHSQSDQWVLGCSSNRNRVRSSCLVPVLEDQNL